MTLAEIAIWGLGIATSVAIFYMIEVLSQD